MARSCQRTCDNGLFEWLTRIVTVDWLTRNSTIWYVPLVFPDYLFVYDGSCSCIVAWYRDSRCLADREGVRERPVGNPKCGVMRAAIVSGCIYRRVYPVHTNACFRIGKASELCCSTYSLLAWAIRWRSAKMISLIWIFVITFASNKLVLICCPGNAAITVRCHIHLIL